MTLVGQPGLYNLVSGVPPEVGSGKKAPDFTPPGYLGLGVRLKGTPLISRGITLTHHAQQLYAIEYGRTQTDFDNDTVTFNCHWAWMEPTLFTISSTGWVQEAPKKRRKA